MQAIDNYFNPFSDHFRESIRNYCTLTLMRKVAAVAAAAFGALLTCYLLGFGGIFFFQLSVKWLQTGEAKAGDVGESVQRASIQMLSRRQVIEELERLNRLSPEERIREALEQGYTVLEEGEENGFTGKGLFMAERYSYQGAYVNGEWHGEGVYIVHSQPGESFGAYRGKFRNNRYSGKGIYFSQGNWYEGMFANNCYEGRGTYRDELNGITLSGSYKNNMLNGDTRILWDPGDRFEGTGEMRQTVDGNAFEGRGVLLLESGTKIRGTFVITFNETESVYHASGAIILQDGKTHWGRFEGSIVAAFG